MQNRRVFIRNSTVVATGFFFPSPVEWGNLSEFRLAITDTMFPATRAFMGGYIGKKLERSYNNRILSQDVDHLIQPFRNRTETRLWQSEFWGKWFTSAVLAYRYHPEAALKKKLDDAVKALLATQTADGYIGNYKKENSLEQWDIWGMKYCLLGLLDHYDLTKDKASLKGAMRLADYLITEIDSKDGIIVNKGNHRGMAASSVLEPIVRLYTRTDNKKYLDFAERIVRQWETPEGPQLISKANVNVSERFPKPANWFGWEQGQKAYEMMSCYEGLLELYRVTGNNTYRQAVEKTWQNIRDNEINICGSGASEEMWFEGKRRQAHPVAHFQETCVTVTWIKLNQQLLRLTGDSKYAEEIERSYYNALLGSLNKDASDWAKYTPLNGQRLPGSGQCGMNMNCCNASGPRGQFTLPLTAVMGTKSGLAINFYVEGKYELQTPKGKLLTVTQATDYPLSGKVRISVELPREEEISVRLRIPAWSRKTLLNVNGVEVIGAKAGEPVELNNIHTKDVIQIEFDMRGRVDILEDSNGKFAAITRGPVVLARDSKLGEPHLNTVNKPVADKEGTIDLRPVINNNGSSWMLYEAPFIPEAYTEEGAKPIPIMLTDYASAGNDGDQTVFQVWMPQLYSGRR